MKAWLGPVLGPTTWFILAAYVGHKFAVIPQPLIPTACDNIIFLIPQVQAVLPQCPPMLCSS